MYIKPVIISVVAKKNNITKLYSDIKSNFRPIHNNDVNTYIEKITHEKNVIAPLKQ